MFISQTHLPQLLVPAAYFAPSVFECEQQFVRNDHWHYVGSMAELPKQGSFFTCDLYGQPVVVWKADGAIRAFLNVCAHRFAIVTNAQFGCTERLKCQYHGWEYGPDGETRKIPDAPCFRPLGETRLGLTELRVETCGQLVFVAFNRELPSLKESLGVAAEVIERLFANDRRHYATTREMLAANWKIKLENTIESYHIDCVHPKTFMKYPAAEQCRHQLFEAGSLFETREPRIGWMRQLLDGFIYASLGLPKDIHYAHYLYYPNLCIGKAGLLTWVESIEPASPTTCFVRLDFFCRSSPLKNPYSRIVQEFVGRIGARISRTAFGEDAAILPVVQRGISAANLPGPGLISAREERIHHFQQYLTKKYQSVGLTNLIAEG